LGTGKIGNIDNYENVKKEILTTQKLTEDVGNFNFNAECHREGAEGCRVRYYTLCGSLRFSPRFSAFNGFLFKI
jgi:hypothetical protein